MEISRVEKNINRLGSGVGLGGRFEFKCYDKLGNLKWSDMSRNLVVDEGLDEILDQVFGYTTQASWFVGLIGAVGGALATGDTLASHAGWTEATGYTDDRKDYTVAAASGQGITNTAAKATFVFSAAATINGAFISAASTGTSGVLFSEATFTAKSVASDDTLEVTYTLSADDDGV